MSTLIIVESPAKAKTIKNFLGRGYDVIASLGHIRDLPKSSFGIKIEGGEFIPEYRITADHSQVVKEIKEKAKSADKIYLATDEDREGEAIAFHIAAAIGKDPLLSLYPYMAEWRIHYTRNLRQGNGRDKVD